MIPTSFDSLSQIVLPGLLLGSSSAKAWYLVPLIVSISLVYGGTRHESLSEILAHSVRTAIWLIVFLTAIFLLVWLSGFGTASDIMSGWDSQLLLAAMAWVFGSLWIAGTVFQTSTIAGLGCLLSGGILALAIGLKSCNLLPFSRNSSNEGEDQTKAETGSSKHVAMWFPVILMIGSVGWACVGLWMRS